MFTGTWGFLDWLIIAFIVIVAIGAALYFLNRWATRKYATQQDMMTKNKMAASIYVIDKKHDKAANVTLPKVVMENLPRTAKAMKMHFVKAKIGPQIMTLMCDKTVYGYLEPKKTYQAELAGIYIVGVKGAKTKYEIKEARKKKAEKKKAD